MPFGKNRLRPRDKRELARDIKLILEVDRKIDRNCFASRCCGTSVPEIIFVVLAVFIFRLGTETDCKDIFSAKQIVATDKIQVPAEIVRINLFDSRAKVRRKKVAFRLI